MLVLVSYCPVKPFQVVVKILACHPYLTIITPFHIFVHLKVPEAARSVIFSYNLQFHLVTASEV